MHVSNVGRALIRGDSSCTPALAILGANHFFVEASLKRLFLRARYVDHILNSKYLQDIQVV